MTAVPSRASLALRAQSRRLVAAGCLAASLAGAVASVEAQAPADWIQLFNGRNLDGWIVKIRQHDAGVNFGNTFRVENGVLVVRYDAYGSFDDRFGHLFFRTPFSHYRLALEYRFVGEQTPGAPGWAVRNSGAMLHSQDPQTMGIAQDFPISVELQLLGGLGDGKARPTANMCSPGTEVDVDAATVRGHCLNSRSRTYDGDQWVRVEAIVLGDSLITHIVNGDTVLTYARPRIGGGSVAGFIEAAKQDGRRLDAGHIALQSEGHAVEFRKVELLNLAGCADPTSPRYRPHVVKADPRACGPD